MKVLTTCAFAIFSLALFAAPQSDTTAKTAPAKPEIRNVPAPKISPSDGAANFKAYCAACHGATAKGDGPAAAAMKLPPTDLTRLAANTGGKYPAMHVKSTIMNPDAAAHGSKDMPIWGPVFRSLGGGNTSDMELRTTNLVKYIETL